MKITYRTDNRRSRGYFRAFPKQSEVQIFTTGSIGNASQYLDVSPGQTLVNGRLLWVTWTPNRQRWGDQLISFNLVDEQFREVPTPDFGSRRCNHPLVLRGCLAAVFLSRIWHLDIWVMKEYDVKELWVKEWRIGRHVPQAVKQNVDKDDKGQPWTISNIADKARKEDIFWFQMFWREAISC